MAQVPQFFERYPIVLTQKPARVDIDTLYDPSIDRVSKWFAIAEPCNDVGRQGDVPVVVGGIRIELPPVADVGVDP